MIIGPSAEQLTHHVSYIYRGKRVVSLPCTLGEARFILGQIRKGGYPGASEGKIVKAGE